MPCPVCGKPTSDGLPCPQCAPDSAEPPEPPPPPYSTRARYIRAAFWCALLAFPLIAWLGIAPLWALSQLLESGRYVMRWYEWYTLPGQTIVIFLYSWAVAYLHRWARWYERLAAGLCGKCSFPLVGATAQCANCRTNFDPRLMSDPASPDGRLR